MTWEQAVLDAVAFALNWKAGRTLTDLWAMANPQGFGRAVTYDEIRAALAAVGAVERSGRWYSTTWAKGVAS